MLKPEGNTILVAQNTLNGFDAEPTELSKNSLTADIAFSAELSRAKESINDQKIDTNSKIQVSADVENAVENTTVKNGSSNTIAPGTLAKHSSNTIDFAQDQSGSASSIKVGKDSTDLSTKIELDSNDVEQKGGLLLNDGVESLNQSDSLAELKSSAGFDAEPGLQGDTIKQSRAGVLVSDGGIESQSSVRLVDSPNNSTEGAVLDPTQDNPLHSISSLVASSKLTKSLSVHETRSVTNTDAESPIGLAGESDIAESEKLSLATNSTVNRFASITSMSTEQNGLPLPATNLTSNTARAGAISDASSNLQIAAASLQAPSIGASNAALSEPAKVDVQNISIDTVGDRSANPDQTYKPSAALVKSGLGRISIEFNNDVSLAKSVADPVAAVQPTVNSLSMQLNPVQVPNALLGPFSVVKTEKVSTVAGHEFLRSIGSKNIDQLDPKLGNSNQVTGTTLNVIEGTQNVSTQALTPTASPIGLANTAPQNSPQQLSEGVVTKADEVLAQTQLRESLEVVAHNKLADVTPSTTLKRAALLSQKADIASLQSLSAPADITSSNVYHVTTNGTITATSSPLNTGPVGDLASAPRTMLLDQPDADQSLVENLRWAVNEKLTRATINVTPANLGPITVSVDVENQNMSVSIVANSSVAKEAIESLLPRMREHFANEGYQQVNVDVSSQQERQKNLTNQSGLSYEHEGGVDADAHSTDVVSEEKRLASDRQRASESLVDTYV